MSDGGLALSGALGLGRPAILALTGAVRQATAYDLAAAFARDGLRVIVTATVPVAEPSLALVPATLHIAAGTNWRQVPDTLRAVGRLAVLGAVDRPDRVAPLDGSDVARLGSFPEADALIVIADGSRHRPIKAPADHEPALPPIFTHVLPMLGLDAHGQFVSEDTAHRPELVRLLLGQHSDHALTIEGLAALLLDVNGGRKGIVPAAQCWPVLYGVTPATEDAAVGLAHILIGDDGVHGVLIQRRGKSGFRVVGGRR